MLFMHVYKYCTFQISKVNVFPNTRTVTLRFRMLGFMCQIQNLKYKHHMFYVL